MERWELERKRSKKLLLFLYVLFHVSKRNQRLTDRCVWPSIAQAIRMKNAWLSKPDECSKYMAFTTHQIWSNITNPFRRRFVGYTNILLFYEKPKATPFQKWKPLSSAFNHNLETRENSAYVFYIHSLFPPKMFQVICKTFIIPDSIRNNDNAFLETTQKSAEQVSTATPKINTKTNIFNAKLMHSLNSLETYL